MAEAGNEQVKNRRQLLAERLQGRYPDKDFSDDEVFMGQISDDYDDYDARLKGYQENEKKITDMFNADPRSANFLSSWANGGDPWVEMIRQFGKDAILDAINDPARLDAIAEADKDYIERLAQSRELQEQYDKNLAESLALADAIQAERGLTDEQTNEMLLLLKGIMADGVVGKISRESMEMALKALNFDKAVADAAHEGEVLGRNTKVEATLRKPNQGDGVPAMDGKNSVAPQRNKRYSIFDEARDAM